MNKLLQRFLNEKVAVRLRTQEEYDQFMQLLQRETDVMWLDCKPTQHDYWGWFKDKTVISFNTRFLLWGSENSHLEFGYEIVEFEDLLKEEEKIMTPAEKLRFLADRVEDGLEFNVGISVDYRFIDGKLSYRLGNKYQISDIGFVSFINHRDDFKLKPQWTFTEDEKVILRNLPDNLQWIARDESDRLFVYNLKPVKDSSIWCEEEHMVNNFIFGEVLFKHLFQSIKWSDDEACEFREYL